MYMYITCACTRKSKMDNAKRSRAEPQTTHTLPMDLYALTIGISITLASLSLLYMDMYSTVHVHTAVSNHTVEFASWLKEKNR